MEEPQLFCHSKMYLADDGGVVWEAHFVYNGRTGATMGTSESVEAGHIAIREKIEQFAGARVDLEMRLQRYFNDL